jgi:hypothetical protein
MGFWQGTADHHPFSIRLIKEFTEKKMKILFKTYEKAAKVDFMIRGTTCTNNITD